MFQSIIARHYCDCAEKWKGKVTETEPRASASSFVVEALSAKPLAHARGSVEIPARMLPAFLTTILFSVSIVCATRSAKLLGGTEANFWRITLATFFLAIWAHTFGQGLGGASFPLFFISGVIGVGADVFLFQGLPRLGSRLTSLIIQCVSALAAAVIEWLWLGTTLSAAQVAACCTILVGVAIALAPGEHLKLSRQQLTLGIGFCILAALGNGYGAVLSRKAFAVAREAHQNIDGGTAGYQRLIGGLLVAGISVLIVKRRDILAQFTHVDPPRLPSGEKYRTAWMWVAFNALAGQTLGASTFQWALKTTPTGLVMALVSTTPLVIIPFAWKFEGERAHRRSVIGGAIAVAGAIALVLVGHK
jgi:drug/metabolite transporter (DMT)-like permease